MNKKQKEELVLALLEKGETYRDIARKAGVSPNTIIHGIVAGETDNEGVIQAIPKRKAEDLIQVIRSGIHGYQSSTTPTHQQSATSSFSLADELTKFAKLKEQGAITEDEYERIKKGLLEGKR